MFVSDLTNYCCIFANVKEITNANVCKINDLMYV